MKLGGQDAVVSTSLFPMKGLAWNCRGLKDPLALAIPKIRALCRSFHNNLDFIFLSETKCDVLSVDILLRPMGFLQSAGCDADGLGEGGVRVACGICVVFMVNPITVNSLDKPFLLIGDFNQVEFSSDKLGGSDKLIRGANLFSYWKNLHCLMDSPFKGPRITWCNNRDCPHRIYERLDKGFASNDWLSLFPNTFIKHLPIQISDHAPIILDTNMDLESYLLDIENGGDSVNYESCHKKLLEFSLAAGTYWRQRTKLKWNCEGDTCTKYFFNWVKGWSGANLILGIKKASNEWTFDMKEIGGLFHKHFSTIFKSDSEPACFEDYLNKFGYLFDNLKRKVGMEEREKLGRVYSKNDVRAAVFQLGPLKSPDPDASVLL
ncbi:uncharacterized protein LOC141602093 [Silene latifolia]|uniref:uncharacterized protein LOC141602093 n=1 Tax=Silene latifolia TaxID=37657 RepID=UPI003D7796F6